MITAAEIQTIRDNDPGAVLPGIDTMTGNPYATSSLLDVTKISQNTKAPYYYSPSANIVYVTQAGAVLSGINFGSATVFLEANNVTIKDCTFSDTTGFWGVSQPSGVSGATVENCTFTGSKSPTEKNDVWISSVLDITVEDNTFLNSPSDTVAIQQGVVTGNYMSGEGYATRAHGDAIYVPDTTGPVTISDNFIDETPNAGAQGYSNSDLRITTEYGNVSDVTVSGNYLIGAGFEFEAGTPGSSNTMSNVSITNNDVGFRTLRSIFPRHDQLCDRERQHDRRFLESDRFNPSPCELRRSNGECMVRERRVYRRWAGADDDDRRRRGVAAPAVRAHRNEFCRWLRPTTSVRRAGRQHSHLSRHRRWRRSGDRFRSGQGRDRSQRRRRRHPNRAFRTLPSSAPLHSAVALRCAIR